MPNEEIAASLSELMESTKNLAEMLMCAYRTMLKEMLDAGAPRELAEEVASNHVRTLMSQLRAGGSNA